MLREKEKKDEEQAQEVTRIKNDLEFHSPERFKVIYDEAFKTFSEEKQKMLHFKPMLDAKIRSIIFERYVQNIESTDVKA